MTRTREGGEEGGGEGIGLDFETWMETWRKTASGGRVSRANTVEGTCHKRGNRDKEEISKRAIVLVNSGGINKRGKFSRKDILFYAERRRSGCVARNFEILSRSPSASSGNSFRLMARRSVESVRDFLVSSEPTYLISSFFLFFRHSHSRNGTGEKSFFHDENSMNPDD